MDMESPSPLIRWKSMKKRTLLFSLSLSLPPLAFLQSVGDWDFEGNQFFVSIYLGFGKMGRKRKSDATTLDDVDRTLYSTFCSAANSLSQLYSQAMNHQKTAFQAGERHALEKLYQWILRHEECTRVTVADIIAHIQREIDYGGEDASSMSPRLHSQHQFPPSTPHFPNSVIQSTNFSGHAHAVAPRTSQSEQSKNSVFSNALSSPVRRSLQACHPSSGQGGDQTGSLPSGNGIRTHETNSSIHNRESNSPSSNDTCMDMH